MTHKFIFRPFRNKHNLKMRDRTSLILSCCIVISKFAMLKAFLIQQDGTTLQEHSVL
jgi:hypothetical protein